LAALFVGTTLILLETCRWRVVMSGFACIECHEWERKSRGRKIECVHF